MTGDPEHSCCDHFLYSRSTPNTKSDKGANTSPATAQLCIMATSDLHMHLLPHDYFSDQPGAAFGLMRISENIANLRNKYDNSLLLDNGDLLQGNYLGDYLAEHRPHMPHPAISYLNLLGYDAATLGNHDFTFGLDHLERVLADADYPITLANAEALDKKKLFHPWVRLDRQLLDNAGQKHPISIGIIGFTPPQTPKWEPGLKGALVCRDMIEAAKDHLPAMRQQGCDLIIALCLGGISATPAHPMTENAAADLAALDIDVVVAGHTHLVFPGPAIPASPGIDPVRGLLHGKPAVMPGFWGSHLGVITLDLMKQDQSWHIAGYQIQAEPCGNLSRTTPAPHDLRIAHIEARQHYAQPIGHCDQPLNSHFSQLGYDAGLKLVAQASRWHLHHILADTPYRDLPILAAVAPFRAGGRGGPMHYTDIKPGPLSRRALTDLYLFPNMIEALLITGAALRDWLERAGRAFATISPDQDGQHLLRPGFPGYNFDVIDGLEWEYDLSFRPKRTSSGQGHGQSEALGRVRNLRRHNQPVADDAQFILATNSYRIGALALYAPVIRNAIRIPIEQARIRDIIAQYIRHHGHVSPDGWLGWRLIATRGGTAVFHTAPDAQPPAGMDLTPQGHDDEGFSRFHLNFHSPETG